MQMANLDTNAHTHAQHILAKVVCHCVCFAIAKCDDPVGEHSVSKRDGYCLLSVHINRHMLHMPTVSICLHILQDFMKLTKHIFFSYLLHSVCEATERASHKFLEYDAYHDERRKKKRCNFTQ